MLQPFDGDRTRRRCYALCVGIGTYTNLVNRSLRYAVADATTIAERLADPQRGSFAVTVLTEPHQTTKAALEGAAKHLLSAPDRRAEDLTLLYFSCHGDINQTDGTFCLLPSNASLQVEGVFDPTALVSIYDFARWFSTAKTQNIVVLLDVCHSGGAGAALQHFTLKLDAGPNFFFIGAARQDQVTIQSSLLQHGLFTHCLLRAFEQPPTLDGWLTISQIHTFVSNEIPWFAKDQPTQIQSWSVSVDPNLPLLRNPQYPELCPLPPLWNVPWPRNIFFTGQEVLLSRLANVLQRNQKTALTQPHALSGLGGIGKTQLALEYAYRHRQDYHAVLWGRADTSEALISTFVNIAHLLDLPQKDEPDQMVIVEAVKTWLRNRSHWLFILDNADNLALVQKFLPPAFRGHLLVTTRAQAMGKVVGSKLEVETMRPEMGALLLLRRARILPAEASLEEAPDEEVTTAKELAEELGGLPLALDQAGAYIEETQCGLVGYQRLYQTRRAELLRSRGGLVDDHPESVASTWSLSFSQVEQHNSAAADLLRLCAFLAPDAIPEELLTQGAAELGDALAPVAADAYQLDQAITALQAYSLISRDPQAHTLTIHRLVQAVLRDSMIAEIQQRWRERVVNVVNAVFPEVVLANWPICERLLPHALICTTWIEQATLVTSEAARLLSRVGSYLYKRGRYGEAESLLEQVLVIDEQMLGSQHPDTVISLSNLAVLYDDQGRYAEVEPLYQRVLAIREQVLGPQHPDIAISLNNLATLYQQQGKFAEAEVLAQRALAIWEQVLGPEHPHTAISLNSLAIIYNDQGKSTEAEPLYQRALAIREQVLGPQHPDTALSLNNLAGLYQHQGKFAEAEVLVQRALGIWEQVLGPAHPHMALSLNNLAVLYQEQGKYAKAEPFARRALAIWEQVLGPQHPDTALSLNNLAELYWRQGKYSEAEPFAQRALAIREQVLGPQHPNTALSLNTLVLLYLGQGKFAEAEPLAQRALVIWEQVSGPEHPNTVISLHNLAELYRKQGKYVEAEPLALRALEICEQQLSRDHPSTAMILNILAILYQEQDKYEEAEPLALRALEICEQQWGRNLPNTALSLNTLAKLYWKQGKYSEAEPLYMHALEIYEQQVGRDHPTAHTIRKNYVLLLRTLGRNDEATKLENQENHEEAP